MVLELRRTIVCTSSGSGSGSSGRLKSNARQVRASSSLKQFPDTKHVHRSHWHHQSPNQNESEENNEADVGIVNEDLTEISLAGGDVPSSTGLEDDRSASDVELVEELIDRAKSGELAAFQRACNQMGRRHLRLDAPGYMGWTAAHWAAREGHVHLLEHLTALHANLDAVDRKGDSLLHKAAANGQHQACQWLLKRGFNVKMRNNNALTPLDLAQELVAVSGRSSANASLCEIILSTEYANTF
ncbi:hypothetical protein BBJ28_00022710 [Nothophytophthora sp. Chile5]|nr:hypothetical protein BBJ28_00022710 [Nothophytophthora sp. Chile5]